MRVSLWPLLHAVEVDIIAQLIKGGYGAGTTEEGLESLLKQLRIANHCAVNMASSSSNASLLEFFGPLLTAPSRSLPAHLQLAREDFLNWLNTRQQQEEGDAVAVSEAVAKATPHPEQASVWNTVAPGLEASHSEDDDDDEEEEEAAHLDGLVTQHYQVVGRFTFSKHVTSTTRVSVVIGPIQQQACDAIVNPANASLLLGAGVAGAIRQADRSCRIHDACVAHVKEHGVVPIGSVALTTAGDLPCHRVLHAVGPSVAGGRTTDDDRRQLAACVEACLTRAEQEGFTTLALPFISSGIFGFPLGEAINIYIHTTMQHLQRRSGQTSSLRNIVWINIKANEAEQMARAWEEHLVAAPSAPLQGTFS
jgi:O-acetyl-ADP-ribose deacetylase (regulator of RNase III)